MADVMADVHRTLLDSMDDSRYVTSIYGELKARASTFSYVNCGHNPPLLVKPNGEWFRLPVGNRAIGMFGFDPDPAPPVTLCEGDLLVLYTDGVVESTNADGVEFGEARLARTIGHCATRPARGIIDALVGATRQHTRRGHYEDDFTVVVIKRLR